MRSVAAAADDGIGAVTWAQDDVIVAGTAIDRVVADAPSRMSLPSPPSGDHCQRRR